MPTDCIFREDSYARDCEAVVVDVTPAGLVLDRTVFYAASGGQPSDTGTLTLPSGETLPVSALTFTDSGKTTIVHAVAGEAKAGDKVRAAIAWEPRYARMRIHTALHLLSAALPHPVTGGAIGEGEGRLDFDIPDGGLDKDAIAEKLNAMIAQDADVTSRWITDDEMAANPQLIKTMTVKPPMGTGRVRLIEIAGLDLQPCGGTHVRNTREIGSIRVTQIEKKGKQNRRVRIAFA